MKQEEVLQKIQSGIKLYQMVSFINSRASFTAKIERGKEYISYSFSDNTVLHHITGKSLIKKGILKRGESTRTLGGTKYELIQRQ